MSWRRRLPVVLLGLCLIEGIGLAIWLLSIRYAIQVTGTEPGWIVIEYQNPNCPEPPPTLLGRSVRVHPDGYACFSGEPWTGPMVLRVHDRNGDHVPDERIQKFGGSTFDLGACRLVADHFFFGNVEEMARSGADVRTLLKEHHPECR